MKVFDDLRRIPAAEAPVDVAIGAFDGVHRGHRGVLRAVRDGPPGCVSCGVFTFDPDPAHVLDPEHAPKILTPTPRRLELLEGTGIDFCVLMRFDRKLAALEPEDFVRRHLLEPGVLRRIVVGSDFRYGRGGRGDVGALRRTCAGAGIDLVVVEPIEVDGEKVSASRIRALVAAGRLDEASRLLGRPFSVWGRVERGRRLGRSLAAATANLDPGEHVLPPRGVYAVAARVEDRWYGGAANLGIRPTLGDRTEPLLEVHLFGFEGELTGRPMEVVFGPFLREERRFESLDALAARIQADLETAARWWDREGRRLVRQTGAPAPGEPASEVYSRRKRR